MKRYHIYLRGTKHIGSVTAQLMAQCIRDYDRFDYPWMANLLRDLCADAKERAKPDCPPVRPLVVNEVQASAWAIAVNATKATRKALECTLATQRHGMFIGWSETPLPDPDTVRCAHCQRPY